MYDLLNDNSGLHDYLQISPDGERVFIRSSNTSKVYEYDVTTWNPIIVQEYDLSGWESRFKVNDDFLYSYSWSKVARWSRSDPEDILDSGDVENVAIRNIDLVGDDVLALSFWYRELYLYDLEVEPEGDLGEEDCDFPYVWNDPKCERYVYSSSLHINTDEGEDVSIASTYNKQDNFYAVLNWNEGDYPAGSINVNGDIYELNYDTNDYMLSSYMVPAPGGVFISLVGLGDNAQVMYFEYPSGNISLYPMPFFGTVGLSINDDGDLLMWEEYGYDYAVAPNDGGFPDFDNLFTSSATEPLSTKGGFIVNGGDVIFQMYSGDVIYAISAASGYTEEDFIDLSGVLGSIEITVKSKPGGYDLYVAGYTSDPTELHIKPYTGCELGAPFSSCTEENPIVMPYGAPIYGISSLLIDEDDNIFFAGSNIGEIGRVLQSNKAVEFFSLTDLDDSIISYDLDNNQNLYITSFNYIYELHQYDLLFESDGGGDPGGEETCPIVSPPYILNSPKCERYVYDSSVAVDYGGGEDSAIGSAYSQEGEYLAVLNGGGGDYPNGSVRINGTLFELNYVTEDYNLTNFIVSAADGSGVFVGLSPTVPEVDAAILFLEYPSGDIFQYDLPFSGWLGGIYTNNVGDLLTWVPNEDIIFIAPASSGFPDFDNYIISSVSVPNQGVITDDGDVIMITSDQLVVSRFPDDDYATGDSLDLSSELPLDSLAIKNNMAATFCQGMDDGYDQYVTPYMSCDSGAKFGCTPGTPIEVPYGVVDDIHLKLVDQDGNVFFNGNSTNSVGRILQSNHTVQLF